MCLYTKLLQWIDNNKQIGKVISFEKNNQLYWSSVAIQKWEGIYKVYIDEILESEMNAENYIKEEIQEFEKIEDAINYILTNTIVKLDQLKPCKGQKIFNPKF